MIHPCETQALRCLTALHALPRPARPEPGKLIVPDFYAAWDVQRAKVAFDIVEDPGALLALRVEIEGDPRWVSLNFALGTASFAAGEVLGLACVAQADRAITIAPYLRSGAGKAMQDILWAETLDVGPTLGGSVALHGIRLGDALIGQPLFHTLILPLPRQSFALTLRDLRFFVLSGAAMPDPALPNPALPDLGSFAL